MRLKEASIFRSYYEKFWKSDDPYHHSFCIQSKARFKTIEKMMNRKHDRILDIGCGEGNLTSIIGRLSTEVVAIDISVNAVKFARKKFGRAHFIVADAEALPFRSYVFDATVASEIIEHVLHPESLLYEMRRVTKINGYMILSTPNKDRLVNKFLNLFKWLRIKKQLDQHLREYSLSELFKLISKCNLRLLNITTDFWGAGIPIRSRMIYLGFRVRNFFPETVKRTGFCFVVKLAPN